ncbi:MAG: hypothetical protein M0Z54_12905 [Thermaerobacter sp.]|nr:hypothetical protein [Thermaerobacter sp.]
MVAMSSGADVWPKETPSSGMLRRFIPKNRVMNVTGKYTGDKIASNVMISFSWGERWFSWRSTSPVRLSRNVSTVSMVW